jgi:hypothetical protein
MIVISMSKGVIKTEEVLTNEGELFIFVRLSDCIISPHYFALRHRGYGISRLGVLELHLHGYRLGNGRLQSADWPEA